VFRWYCHAQKECIESLGCDISLSQEAFGDIRCKQHGMLLSEVALPASKRCRPVETIRYEYMVELQNMLLSFLDVETTGWLYKAA
jgi:hypothetical protein